MAHTRTCTFLHMAPPAHLDTNDPAVHLDQRSHLWIWEDDSGNTWEWHSRENITESGQDTHGHWIPTVDEQDISKQQEGYAVEGVDESVRIS